MMSSTQRRTFAWPMRSWICLSNSCSIGIGSVIAAVDADERDRAAAADDVDREVQRGAGGRCRRSRISLRGDARRAAARRSSARACRPATPWASMPTASMTASGPRPSVSSRTAAGDVVDGRSGRASRRRATAPRASRSGTRSTPITVPAPQVLGDRARPSRRSGPRPSTTTLPPSGIAAYSTACQAVGSTSDRYRKRSSGGPFGHLDRAVLRLRHAQALGLAARHLAVELGVAEQRGAHALLAHLGRLALRLQARGRT